MQWRHDGVFEGYRPNFLKALKALIYPVDDHLEFFVAKIEAGHLRRCPRHRQSDLLLFSFLYTSPQETGHQRGGESDPREI